MRCLAAGLEGVELRVVHGDMPLRPARCMYDGLPLDLQDKAHGKDASLLGELAKNLVSEDEAA